MKTKSNGLIRIAKWLLDTIWYANFALIAIALYFFSMQYVQEGNNYFNEKVTINMHKSVAEQENLPDSDYATNISLFKNTGRVMMTLKDSVSNMMANVIAFILLESLVVAVLFHLRKIVRLLLKGSPFVTDNIKHFKCIACFVGLYSPLNWVYYLHKDWILRESVAQYDYTFGLDWTPDFVGILLGIVIFGVAKVLEKGWEVEEENKAFV